MTGGDIGGGSTGGSGIGGVTGSASVGGGAGVGGVTGGAGNANISSTGAGGAGAGDVDVTGDAEQQIGDATIQGGTRAGEARVMNEAGPQGSAIARGGAQGVTEREFTGQGEISQREGEARSFERGQGMDVRAGIDKQRDGAVETSGYKDPVSEAGRVEQLEVNQRNEVAGKATVTTDKVNEGQRIAADPQGAARGEADVRIDQKTGDARQGADEVVSTARDPGGAAQSRADSKIAEAKRDATGKATADVKVSSDGSASASTSTDKPGDKK